MVSVKRTIRYCGHMFFRNKDGYYRDGRTTLHRYKYEKKYGKIFSCFHLHHIDGNKFNNCLSNLVMLTFQEHLEMHKLMRRKKMYEKQMVLNFEEENGYLHDEE